MRVPVNLASQPFRPNRPVIVGASLLSLVLLVLLGALISSTLIERAQLADSRQQIAQLDAQVRSLNTEQTRLDAVLRRPENSEVLERSLFLNTLLYRKGISWTRIFADLEKTLPHNVRIISIRPSVNSQNQVTLDMVVGSESPEPMIGLLKSLEGSPLFGAAYLHSALPPSQTNPLFQYRVSVNYAQKL
jgi:Tfp pilus assembly protein PilN